MKASQTTEQPVYILKQHRVTFSCNAVIVFAVIHLIASVSNTARMSIEHKQEFIVYNHRHGSGILMIMIEMLEIIEMCQ